MVAPRCSKVVPLASIAFIAIAFYLNNIVLGASHREAPLISRDPTADGTDFYMFRSYEPGREDFVTLIANYLPLQDPYGGPNYFPLDPDVLYNIHIDNDGDAVEDLTFRFRFNTQFRNQFLPIGPRTIFIPIINRGPIFPGNDSNLNVIETYTLELVEGDSRPADAIIAAVSDTMTGAVNFQKPVDNIGEKSIPDYAAYAQTFIHNVTFPGGAQGRVFVGQRKDPFVVNLGDIFDLVNIADPVGPNDADNDDLAGKNVTAMVLEVPISYLTGGSEPVIGGWTTAERPAPTGNGADITGDGTVDHKDILALAGQYGGAPITDTLLHKPVSRLGNPLVNELLVGLPDKDAFNRSHPTADTQFQKYFEYPVLPQHLAFLFPIQAPTLLPRQDLLNVYMLGLPGVNQPQSGVAAEMLRLNTTTTPTAGDQQNPLGVLGGDDAGYPNGRRPGDDVVDISLRVAMGALLSPSQAPSGQEPFTDGAYVDASRFNGAFPYLATPIAGSLEICPTPTPNF